MNDSFSNSVTSVKLNCPADIIPVERLALAAQGDLQRLLSTFLGRDISITRVFANTAARGTPASPEHPIKQTRQVHLVCSGRVVCVATSTVTITSPECERLFLDEKYAIGQLFRHMRRMPEFALLDVNTQTVEGKRELRRTYTLGIEGILCEILEEFPDRDLFVKGAAWFDEEEKPISGVLPASNELFSYTPHSVDVTPTFPSILAKQAADPVVGGKVLAAYPRPLGFPSSSASPSPYLEITYSDFDKLVEHEASFLSHVIRKVLSPFAAKAAEAPVVAVLDDSSFFYAVRFMALLKINATVFLLAPFNSEPAIKHLLAACNVAILLAGQKYAEIAQSSTVDSPTHLIVLDNMSKGYETFTSGVECAPSKVLYPTIPVVPAIIHSSGSTSFPKPVPFTNASFLSNSQVMLTGGGWSAFTKADNRFLCLGPMFHIMGLTIGLGGALCAGSTIVFPLTHTWPPSPDDIVQSLRQTKVDTCIIVPLLLEQLVDSLEADISASDDPLSPLINLNLLLAGGAHCPDELADRLTTRGVNLKCVYGSSETGHMMVGSHSRDKYPSWNLMQPFPHTSILFKPLEDNDTDKKLFHIHMAPGDVRMAYKVLKPGQETWNTGDVVEEVPAGSGWYKLLYRDDDILVHVSGEKTNPVPMESATRSHKLVSRISIIGHRRPVTAALVQLDDIEAQRYTADERISIIKDLIAEVNLSAPSHSRVMEEMIMVLPLGYHKQIPITAKGNCIRPKVMQLFEDEIESIYQEFAGENDSSDSSATSNISAADLHEQVTKIFEGIVKKTVGSTTDSTKSLFDIGLDSITALQLRNRLSKTFNTKLPAQFIYQNFSLDLLAAALHARLTQGSSSESSGPTKGEILSELREKQLHALRGYAETVRSSRVNYKPSSGPEAKVVAIVGAAGSLGVWQVKALFDQPDVQQVVCMARGANISAVYDKMAAGFKKAGMADLAGSIDGWRSNQLGNPNVPAVKLNQRLTVLPFDLANPHLDDKEYQALASTLTTIIHAGWKMDFNQSVQSFEPDCLDGTTQLLLLAGLVRPKHFYFISSIGVVMESRENPVPEKIYPWSNGQYITASPHGYSESKFIAEYAVEAASSLFDIPCSAVRIGQITGDSVRGVWKTQEMNPIIIAGSARIGKLPLVLDFGRDWTPVDTVGSVTVELALNPPAPGALSINHIVNRYPTPYVDVVRHLCAAGISVVATPPDEWWSAIQADEQNPCLAIEAYIEDAVVKADVSKSGGKPFTLDISETIELAPVSFARCPPINGALWNKYVQNWRELGFIGK